MPFGSHVRIALAPATATVTGSSTTIVAENLLREGLVIVNVGANNVSLAFGATAIVNGGITLTPNGVMDMDPWIASVLAVNAISAGGSTVAIQEYTR